jgi:hypothetical protein
MSVRGPAGLGLRVSCDGGGDRDEAWSSDSSFHSDSLIGRRVITSVDGGLETN